MKEILTDLASCDSKTDITDKTNILDNINFLRSIFGETLDDARPIIVSFKGSPKTVDKKKWFGVALNIAHPLEFASDANNYFSLAKFIPDETGQYRRKKTNFQGLYAVMLDDIGTKVSMDRLTLTPSWLLETSPGNYQAGYILTEALTDSKTAEQLVNAIINAGLCDPGANGPSTRLARLPVGINGKHEIPFCCQMKDWLPGQRYSLQDLIKGLQLEIIETKRSKRVKENSALGNHIDNDSVLIPRPTENTVLTALSQRNLYKAPLGGKKHDITCPWKQEHTDAIDNGTAYFEPGYDWPIGGFKCLHGHCANRHIRDLLDMLNIDLTAARMKPVIHVIAGELHRVVDAAERELALSEQYFQRGGLIVTVWSDPGLRETSIQTVSQPALVRALAGVAIWQRLDARAKDWVRTDPPARHTTVLFDANNYLHLPVLNGLARQPYLRPDGSLMTASGYDAVTGMFGVFDSRKFSVPDSPSRIQAEAALVLLQDILAEFRFANESDRSAALAAILTATIRPSLSLAPMFHVRAHTLGSGKSYLCELITAFATPQRGTPTTFPADDEECRKLLLADLLRGPAVVEFDNLTSDLLAHKSLCTALTSEFISGRILGVSKTASVNTRTLFLSSGNNVGPIQDMARRCITIHLDPAVEIPAAITFKHPDLVREVLQEREKHVAAALTIIRAWIVSGSPKTICKSLASYGQWSDLCRQSLLWLGCDDPTSSVFEALSEDPDRETLARLLNAWQSVFGKAPAMVREAITRSTWSNDENNELKEVLNDIADERGMINRRKLGWWIRRHAGQVVDGRRFVRCSGNSSAEKWRVESVSSILSVLHGTDEKTVSTDDEYLRAYSGE
jgi:hypothetical protein